MSDTQKQVDAWKVLFDMFPDGEKVIVILDNDDYWWGKFTHDMNCCKVGGQEYDWNDVVVIAKEGFPVKFLKTGVAPEFFIDQDNSRTTQKIREAVALPPAKHVHHTKTEFVFIRSGDPWLIPDVHLEGFNLGNVLPDTREEEFLIARTAEGQQAIIYDLPLIFEFGTVCNS